MRSPDRPQSTTSLPRAPREDEAGRTRRYLITMAIRTGCFVLAVVVQPYGWWTWAFLLGAIFLPYFAVVMANVGMDARAEKAQSPERMLPAAGPQAAPSATAAPRVIRLSESPASPHAQQAPEKPAEPPGDGTAA